MDVSGAIEHHFRRGARPAPCHVRILTNSAACSADRPGGRCTALPVQRRAHLYGIVEVGYSEEGAAFASRRDVSMLRVFGESTGKFCDGIRRRSFLEAGVLGLGGLALSDFFHMRAEGAVRGSNATNVILFWLSGGPGHMETWDPKPQAVAQYRGPFGAISTAIPGVQLGELLPEQARVMDKLAILRTVNHGSGDHTKGNPWMLTGFDRPDFNAPDNTIQRRPALGSVSAMFRGANRPGMPAYVGVPHLRGGTDNLFHYAAYLGGGYNPFIVNSDPNEKNYRVRDLSLSTDLTLGRLESRQHLLESIDQLRAR